METGPPRQADGSVCRAFGVHRRPDCLHRPFDRFLIEAATPIPGLEVKRSRELAASGKIQKTGIGIEPAVNRTVARAQA